MRSKDTGSDAKLNSIIGKGSNCAGDIEVSGGLKIDGQFKGKIKAQSLYVGRDAYIEATIHVNHAVIGGKVLGDVIASEYLELQSKAELIGNVNTKKILVAENAIIDGTVRMGREKEYNNRPAFDDDAKSTMKKKATPKEKPKNEEPKK